MHNHRFAVDTGADFAAQQDSVEALSPVELKDAKPVELTDSLEADGKCKLCGAELNKAPWR